METDSNETALAVFRRHGGILRTREAIRHGIHPRTLYTMRDSGVIQYSVADFTDWLICRRFPTLTW